MEILNPKCFHLVVKNSVCIKVLKQLKLFRSTASQHYFALSLSHHTVNSIIEKVQDCFASLKKSEDSIGYVIAHGRLFTKICIF